MAGIESQILGAWGTPAAFLRWLSVNVGLAVVPVLLALLIGRLGRAALQQPTAARWLLLSPLMLLWLLFLPNTCYLWTDLRHAIAAVDRGNLWIEAGTNRQAREGLLFWAAVAGIDLLAGAVTYTLAIRPVLGLIGNRKVARLIEPPFFLLLALGLYLGLVARFNSWDMATRPGNVIETAMAALSEPRLLLFIAPLALGLWLSYEALNLWLDGLRHRRAGRHYPPGLSAEAGVSEPGVTAVRP